MAANHIGNPKDFPLRSKEALQSADLLIFEEDRPARQALKEAGIHRSYLKFNEHNPEDTLTSARKALKDGKTVLYMSDQGCPTFADPGRPILELAYQLKSHVSVIPGPSSLTSALAACPFHLTKFSYAGFLPQEQEQRKETLTHLIDDDRNGIILLDTPYRLNGLLNLATEVVGRRRELFLALDISGPHEAFLLGYAQDLLDQLTGEDKPQKLNFVLIISPNTNGTNDKKAKSKTRAPLPPQVGGLRIKPQKNRIAPRNKSRK